MPTRRPVHVDDNATTIRETNRFLKMPHTRPETVEQHAANVREIERWGNRIPYSTGSGSDCCSCWRYLPITGSPLFTAADDTYSVNLPTDPFESYTPSTSTEVEVPGRDLHVKYQLQIPNSTTPGDFYQVSAVAQISGHYDFSYSTFAPVYAPSDTTGTRTFADEMWMHIYPANSGVLTLYLELTYYNEYGSITSLPGDVNGNFRTWNRSACGWFQDSNDE